MSAADRAPKRGKPRGWRRALRLLGRGLLGLVALVVLLVAWALHTDSGRDVVRRVALRVVNGTIAGELQIDRLEHLGLDGIVCRGVRLLDPQAEQVASLDRLSVHLTPEALLVSHVQIDAARLEGLHLDLRHLAEADRGLLAAVRTAPSAPKKPDAKPSAWVLDVKGVELTGGEVTSELAPLGVVRVRSLSLTGEVHIADALVAQVRGLSFEVYDEERQLGELVTLTGSYRNDGEPSGLALSLRAGGADVELSASAVAPPADDWEHTPISLDARLSSLGPELLRLAHIEPPPQLGHPLGLTVKLTGTPADIRGNIELSSPAGDARLTLQLKDRDALKLALDGRDLDLQKVWSDAPADALSAHLNIDTSIDQAPARVPFRVELRSASFGKLALPEVDLAGRIDGEHVRDVVLHAEGYGGVLDANAEAAIDGSVDATVRLNVPDIAQPLRLAGMPHARGTLRMVGQVEIHHEAVDGSARVDVDALHVDKLYLEKAQLDVTVRGELPDPGISAVLKSGRGSWAGTPLQPGTVRISGGPKDYRLAVEGGVGANRVALKADASRMPDGVKFNVTGSGQLLGKPLALDVRAAEVDFDGRIKLGAAEVEALGQKLSAKGNLRGKRTEELVVETHDLDLAEVSQSLGLNPTLAGHVDARVALSGSLARPLINLSGAARDVRLPARSDAGASDVGTVSARWQATLDTGHGKVEGQANVTTEQGGKPGPTADLELSGRFPTKRPWAQQLLEGEDYAVRLAIDGVTTHYLEAWLGARLPVEGTVGAVVTMSGKPLRPTIGLSAHADLRHPETHAPVRVAAEAHYDAGRVELSAQATDRHGEWVWLEVGAQAADEPLRDLLARRSKLADQASWRVRLRANERKIEDVPIAIAWPDEAKPARVLARLTATHEAGGEPDVDAAVDLLYPAIRPPTEPGAASKPQQRSPCHPRPLVAHLNARLHEGGLSVTLLAGAQTHPWLTANGSAKLAVAPLLRGEAAVLPSDVGYDLELGRIEAAELPVVCSSIAGSISGAGKGRDLLGKRPVAGLDLVLDDIGTRETLNGKVSVRLDERGTQLVANLTAGGKANRLRVHLPLSLSEGKPVLKRNGPLEAKVDLGGLPLGAIIPARGPLSGVSGGLSGEISASGTLDKPRVSGSIRLRDIGLTLTAMAQPLRRINGLISFDTDRLRVHDLVASDRNGSLTLNGEVELAGLPDRSSLRFDVNAKDFPVRRNGQVAATVNLDAHIRAKLDPEHTEANVTMRELDVWLEESHARGIPLDPHPDIIDPRAATKKPEPLPDRTRTLRLVLDMSRPFWIKRDDMGVKLSAKLDTRVDPDGVRVTGAATIQRGYLQLLGMVFDVDKDSSITFVGSNPPDPVVDIGAHMENRRSGSVVGVRITGRVSKPELAFLVNGAEVTPGEAVAAMFGKGSSADENAAEGQAKSMLAGIAGGMLALAARKELGAVAPIILVDPGDDASKSRVRVGFDLDELVPDFMSTVIRGVYVEGMVAGDDGSGTGRAGGGVLLDLFLPASLVLTGQYGPGQTWGVDFGWEP